MENICCICDIVFQSLLDKTSVWRKVYGSQIHWLPLHVFLLFFPSFLVGINKLSMHFLYVTPPPQNQHMILLFAVLMRYLHVSWSRKRDIGDITSSPPLRQLTDRKIYTHDINVFRNVCSPNEQLAHLFVKIPARNNTWK